MIVYFLLIAIVIVLFLILFMLDDRLIEIIMEIRQVGEEIQKLKKELK